MMCSGFLAAWVCSVAFCFQFHSCCLLVCPLRCGILVVSWFSSDRVQAAQAMGRLVVCHVSIQLVSFGRKPFGKCERSQFYTPAGAELLSMMQGLLPEVFPTEA